MDDNGWVKKLADWSLRNAMGESSRSAGDFAFLVLAGILGFYIGGPVFIGWFIWKQVTLEKGFYDRYGQNWVEEYQKYHGSLTQAHLKIAMCLMALVSIMAIGIWCYRQVRHRKIRH